MSFDPKRHIMKLKGKDYLPIAARLIWFRDEHPDWGIVTTPVEINMEKQYAIFSASIFNGEGKLMATATKMENVQGFGDFIEKAETGSVGRALAYCGFGTQFAPELEEGGRFAHAPYGGGGMGANRFASGGGNGNSPRPNTYGGNGGGNGNGGNGNGGGYNNAPRPNGNGNTPPVQAARPAPVPMRPDDDFGGDDGEGEPAPAPPRPAQTAAARPPAPAPTPPAAPANGNGGVMRVREPEQDFADPGGDDDSDEDPFADEEDAPLTAAPMAKPAGRAASAAAPAPPMDDEDDAPIAPPPTGNKCAAEGCGATMPPAMVAMTTAKFGRPLCPVHQKEAVPIIGGNMAVGANPRPRAKVGAGASSGGNGDGGLL